MPSQILINLPSKNLDRSKAFFSTLKLPLNSDLSDENTICFTVQNNTLVVLSSEQHFEMISGGAITDTSKNHEVLVSIGMNSKAEVDELVNNAISAGGKELHEPQDHGWIYGRSFADLDGHQWNAYYMNLADKPK